MAERLPPAMLARLRELLAERMGIHFSAERVSDLERAMESAAREAGYSSTEACLQELLSSPWKRTQIELLARHLSVGETYFFRDKKIFETLERHVLPELIRSRDQKRLRIWSAGCATGEEPYSVAILLRRSLPDLADWHVTILATDINPSFLEKARRGVYSEWSFRDAPRWLKEHYFRRRREGLYEIGPEVREMVVFSYLNLAEDQYPSLLTNTNAMDLVLCRNVLMYFAAEKARSVLDRLHRALVDGGWLITSPSEVSDTLVRRFRRVSFDDATLYKKDAGPAETRLETPEVAGLVRSGIAPEAAAGAPPSFTVGTESEISFSALASGSAFEARPAVRSDRGAADSPAESRPPESVRESGDAASLARLARSCANEGRLQDARRWCAEALERDKLDPALYFLEGLILQEQGALDGASTSLRRALYLDPNFALAHFALGNLAARRGRSAEARRHFDHALSALAACRPEDVLPESEGLTAGRLIEIIGAAQARRGAGGRRHET